MFTKHYENQWNLMIFDLKIGTNTVKNRPQDGLKGVLSSSSIFVSILARAWLHFGSFGGALLATQIDLKSTLIFFEN